MHYQEQQLEHVTAHEDLRNLVHDAFSPDMGIGIGMGMGMGMGNWMPDGGFDYSRGGGY